MNPSLSLLPVDRSYFLDVQWPVLIDFSRCFAESVASMASHGVHITGIDVFSVLFITVANSFSVWKLNIP